MSLNKLVFLAALFGFACSSASYAEKALPDITVNETSWQTAVLENQDFDKADETISVLLLPPAETMFSDFKGVVRSFFAACGHIMSDPAKFAPSGVVPSDFTFVQMAIEIDDQRTFPYPLNFRIVEGQCSDKFSFGMPTLSDPFSTHDPHDEVLAVLHSWGMGLPQVSFEAGTSGRKIEVEFPLLSAFHRKVEELNASALCVHSIANVEKSFTHFGIPVNAANYPKIEIQVVETLTSGSLNTRKVLGSVSFSLLNGQCAP